MEDVGLRLGETVAVAVGETVAVAVGETVAVAVGEPETSPSRSASALLSRGRYGTG